MTTLYKNPKRAHAYLAESGWDFTYKTFLNHKERGLIRPNQDGKYDQLDLDRYAAQNHTRKDGSKSTQLDAIYARRVVLNLGGWPAVLMRRSAPVGARFTVEPRRIGVCEAFDQSPKGIAPSPSSPPSQEPPCPT